MSLTSIDVSRFRVIYRNTVFNAVEIIPEIHPNTNEIKNGEAYKFQFITLVYVDDSGELRLIKDEAWAFQFIKDNRQ